MKVLMLNEVCGVTSTGRICTDIADILTKNGHNCVICYGRDDVPHKYLKYAHRIGSNISVYLHAALSRVFDRTGFYSVSTTKELIKFIKEYKPDIIHIHNIHGYYIHIGILFDFLKTLSVPVVWTFHDCWPMTGHCTCSDFIGCNKWLTQCENCPQKNCYPASLLADASRKNYIDKKRIFTGVDDLHIVTPSLWLKKQVEKSFLSSYETIVISSGIDTDIFKPTPSDFRKKHNLEGKKILLAVANAWSDRKGIADYIKLSQEIDDSYKLVMVGNLRGKKIPENILCIDHTNDQTELAQIYTEADVFLNFSYEETQGLTTIESLACGTPAIVVNRTAIPECITPECGVIIEKYEKNSFSFALEQALKKSKNACIQRAMQYKKFERFEDYINLYERLCK